MLMTLKVGSCPDDDNSVQCYLFFFCLFLCSNLMISFSEPIAAEKTAIFC